MKILVWREFACLFCLLLFSQGCMPAEPAEESIRQHDIPPGVLRLEAGLLRNGQLQLATVDSTEFANEVTVTGRVGLNEEATVKVGTLVEGRILGIKVKVGDHVRAGQLLAQLHSREVHEARADFAQAVADVRTKEAELEFARSAAQRAERLLALKAGSLEHQERAQANLAQAKLAVKIAEAEVSREAEHLLHLGLEPDVSPPAPARRPPPGVFEEHELVSVHTPIGGTVLSRLVTLGTVVTPAEDLFLISDLSTIWVHADLPEQYLASLDRKLPVKVEVQAYSGEIFVGRIYQVADVMNTGTRTVHVVCELPNQAGKLKSEMYAVIRFDLGTAVEALVIPTAAVQTLGDESIVFVESSDSEFESRTVQLGRRVDGQVEVLSGLSLGERVVTTGSFLLKSELLRSQIEEE